MLGCNALWKVVLRKLKGKVVSSIFKLIDAGLKWTMFQEVLQRWDLEHQQSDWRGWDENSESLVFSNRGHLREVSFPSTVEQFHWCVVFVRKSFIVYWDLYRLLDPNLENHCCCINYIIVCMFQYSTRPVRIEEVCIFVMKPRIMWIILV